jgi:Raf kinase inhibitor-like YbhB/YbcL family protein
MDSRKSASDERFGPAGLARRALARSVAACALAALAAIVVAGCGESSGSTTTTTVAQSAQPASSATTPGSAAPGSSQIQPSASGSAHATSTAKTPTTPFTVTPHARAGQRRVLGPKAAEKALNVLGLGGIVLTSSAFRPFGPIATRYTCDGAGTSPQIRWRGVPSGTAQLLLEAGDIAGGTSGLVQWAVAIPASASEIPAGSLPPGAVAGVNSAGKVGWGGVCGPKGVLQDVTFRLYALRHKLSLQSGFNPSQVRSALKGDTLGAGLTLATYTR